MDRCSSVTDFVYDHKTDTKRELFHDRYCTCRAPCMSIVATKQIGNVHKEATCMYVIPPYPLPPPLPSSPCFLPPPLLLKLQREGEWSKPALERFTQLVKGSPNLKACVHQIVGKTCMVTLYLPCGNSLVSVGLLLAEEGLVKVRPVDIWVLMLMSRAICYQMLKFNL